MTYKIRHLTTYQYHQTVSFGNHAVCLTPRSEPHHRCLSHELRISPAPATGSERVDFFGNRIRLFTITEPHEELQIEAQSLVTVDSQPPTPRDFPAWDQVVAELPRDRRPESLDAFQFVFESPRIRPDQTFAAYASPSFPRGRPFHEALLDLTSRIHADFLFDSKATDVKTAPEEVLVKRKGVCQDFAHLQIACLRSLQIPARYVSGYLRTYPPPGRPRLIGADASHAWVSAYCPGFGWFDVDPTNNMTPRESHVTLAWGRDYGDVSPVRGMILGGRDHEVEVAVDMEPLDSIA